MPTLQGRYIKLKNNSPTLDHKYVICPQVFVYDHNDINIALNKPTSASSQLLENTGPKLINNGVFNQNKLIWGQSDNPGGGFAHTNNTNATEYIMIDLENDYYIKSIVVWHRSGWRENFNGGYYSMEVINENGNVIENYTFTTTEGDNNTFNYNPPPPPTLDIFTITPTDITVENHGTINMTFSDNNITQTDISNSLTVDPSNVGIITNITGSGTDWSANFVPYYHLDLTDCSLNFNNGANINKTENFNVETYIQQIKSIILTPDTIVSDLSSNLQVELRIPSTVAPNISIDPSYVAYLDGSMTSIDNLIWTGTIYNNNGFNSINNILTVDISGISSNITFDVLEEDVVLSSNYYVTNSGKKIMYSPFSRSAVDNQGKIEVYDSSGNIEHTFIEDTISSVYVNQEGNMIVIGLPKDDGKVKSYLFEDGSWNEYYNYNNEYPNGTNLGELVHLTGNNELMVVNNTTGSNYEVDIYEEGVARYATYFATDVSSIVYPNNTLNFEVKLTTNDVPLADISANASNLFTVDPSYVGYIDANSLSLSNYGFSLHGTFTVSGEYNEPNVKLFYNDFSSNSISLYSVQDLSINDFYFDSSFVTYLNHTTNKITLVLNRVDITNVDVSNSLILNPSNCGSITGVIDGSNSSIKKITFEPAYNFENTNCSLTFDYNQGLLDASQTIFFSVNNYVPQIANITNDNSFNYIDTSGTILLEFDRNLLRDLSLNDLSYNDTKLDLQLEKLSDSSYNILLDPSGEYVETQVITVKDLLGTDLSNISLQIDTIIPTFSEITMAPGALNYEVSGGILDVKFNKTLLDRDQLVLTSSSDISFSFLQQYDIETSSTLGGNSMPVEPSLNNFTYTINGDASENIIKAALQKWDNIIVKHPIDVNNSNPSGTTKIHITFSVSDMDAGTLGYAYVDYVYFEDLNHNGQIDYSDNIYTSSGFIALSQASYNSMISEIREDGNTTLYYVLMHEIGHIIGIGPYFGHNNSPRVAYEENGVTKYYYTGAKALAKYKMYMNDASLVGIPIEDDGGAGTVNVHPEEHRIEGQTRHIGGHPHEGLDEELMTGWTESGTTIMPLSAVTIGFLEDMGYDVSYAFADIYRNMDYDGNAASLSLLKMGITMDTTLPVFPTYSVVQYEVKSNNYGLKSIQDISFNYRGTHDVSNINIDVNTIIPDVSSIYIENILYSDTSGIVTITFNDHDGYYFHGKDASMNIYLDPSSNGNITLNMETIPSDSNVWTGVITTISGEFYPDAALYLQHSGMNGLINVDVSATYRLDTDIRGLYITLPEMGQRSNNNEQTINYLTYDHNTNKLETDVSFQFNIDVSGVNHDSRQFPYTDICENFIEITSTDLSNGTVELDKNIGFTGKFWNGILTISGEVEGTFDICYNETLNPLRDDGVIEIREDKLTVNVNTILPDISNVMVPDKLTYLDISGDVEIEFDKAILTGDENNIQIEYSLEDTYEYQFLDKYRDNAVDGSAGNYVFNSIPYDANKKIALGIGTYTLNVSSDHPIDLSGNYSNISISGINTSNGTYGTGYYGTVTITVTGDFGTASYKCSSHGYMGGENRLVYKDVEVSPLVQNHSATHWKYTLSLPQEIDTSLNVTIKYRDEISGPHIIPIYGIVPDVLSVTLSKPDLTYNDPSCVVTVEFNNVLQGRTNIYDLISLEPSSELFIQDASFSSTDNRVWTGILDISNNERNEFEYTDAKVSVNGIQSDAFGQGISGETLFNIDTILPDVSNISVSNLVYSINNNNDTVTKTTDFTITFTKTDLSGIDISNSLSVTNNNLSITNVNLVNNDTLTGNIITDVSGIYEDVSFVLQYDFGYRNGTLNKDIDMSVNFTVDTVIRTVSISSNNSNLTYLTPSCEITVTFNTDEEHGKDISNNIAVKDINGTPIGYTLDPYELNVSGNMWKATINISDQLDVSGIIDISYNNGINNLHSQIDNVRFYTIVPDVSSVTLSASEISYETPSIDLQVEYNKVLESRNNIFDLITLNASANLIEISGNSVSYDATNNVFKGTLKLTNTTLHDGTSLYRFEDNLKVVVNSLQSAMFSHIGISGESQLFQVDTLQQIEKIELDTHHIYYPDVSNILTVDFRIPIPSDTSLNNYVTLDEGYIVSQDNFVTANNGKTWTSVVTRVENMNLLDNKFAIDYSYNGLYNVSGEILFNAMENPEQRYMKFEEFDSSFVGRVSGDKLGTGMALSYDNQIMAISSIYPDSEKIEIYRLENDNWTEIGIIPEKANSLALSEDGKIIVIGNDVKETNGYNVGNAKVYTYIEDYSWNLLYTINPDDIFKGYSSKFGRSVSISNNGSIIAVGISEYRVDPNNDNRGYVKLYKRINSEWISIIDLSGNENNMLFGSNVKLSGNGLTLAVGSPGFNDATGKINVYSFNDDYSTVSMDNEFIGDNSNNQCGKNITLTNDGKMINYGLDSRNEIIIQNLENDTSYNFVGIGTSYGISTLSNDKKKLFIFREELISSERKNYIESYEFYNNTWKILGTKRVLTTINSNDNVKFISSNDGKRILYSNDNYNYNGGTNNGIVKTYNNEQSIRRRVLNFDLDLSNVLYPDISTNFTINFTTNDVSMEDISNNLSIDPSNMGIIEVTETTNNGFNWVGKFTATELLKNDNNQLIYEDALQENNIYTDTSFISFNIDRSPLDVSLLEITSLNSVSNHIRYDDVSGAIYLEFTRDQVTIDDVSFVTIIKENLKVLPINSGTIRDISTNDSGVSWNAVFEPSSNLISDCSLIFEYSGNEFELPVYRDYGFTIDTVTPDVSAININNISYTSNKSDVIVIFTKNDLNDRIINMNNDISFSLTNINSLFNNYDISFVTHVDNSDNTVINNIWKTKLSVSGELFCDCEVVFHYVDPNGFYDISLSSSISIDTRKRGVEQMGITNHDGIINGYLFNYLDNSGSFLLDFFTNDLSGTDISSNLSLNGVSYTLDNYTVINDRLETNITINSGQHFLYKQMDFSLNSVDGIFRTGNTDPFNIDTRPREVTDISFNGGNKLSYLDPSGILTITFNLDIFETVDIITSKLNYITLDLSLSSPQISNNIYTCTLTSNREFIGSSDVSINYNGFISNKTVTIQQDTITPRLDLSNCSISSHFIQYNQRYIDISLTFTNEIEDFTNISNTLVVDGLQDTSYNFSTFTTNNGGKFWSGQLNITEYDISLSDLYIYSNYQSGTTHTHQNLRFNVNTIRPYIESINFDKDILTYLEPSCNISITFGGSIGVLDTNIDEFINYSDISLSSFIKQSDNKTWNSIVDVYQLNIQNFVDLSINFYDQIRDTSINVFTVLPEVKGINFGKVSFTYLDKSAYDFSIEYKNYVYDDVNDIVNSFQFENFPNAYTITYNSNTIPYKTITGDLIFNYDVNIANALINYSYTSERFGNKLQSDIIRITSIDTRIPNITQATNISNTNLTYDASSTQLDVYFDASLLDISASSILDASLVTSFSHSSIHISSFTELSKTHYRANITTEYGIDKSQGNSVTVNYMDNSTTLYFNVDTILRPYSNICFPRGEKVLTDNGYKNIEQIDIKMDTIRGEKIEELTQTQTQENELVLIKCGALMKNMPNKDTFVTNYHKILYKGNLVEAYKLVTLVESGVELVDYNGETLYNILLEGEKEGKMVVNGMIVETLSPSNNIARLYRKIRKYGTTEYKKKRMIELFNQQKKEEKRE